MKAAQIVASLLEMVPRSWCPRSWVDPSLAADALEFIKSHQHYRKWAKSGCEEAAFSWANALSEVLDRNRVKVMRGGYEGELKSGIRPDPHYWVLVDDAIFDPTAEQFEDYPDMDPSKYSGRTVE